MMDKYSKPLGDIYTIKKELYESGKPIGDHASDYAGHHQERIGRIYIPKAQFLLDAIGHPTTLLDIGAGAGYFVHAARKLGFDAIGIEPNFSLIYAGNTLPTEHLFCVPKLQTAEFITDSPSEAVSLIGVLEHIPDPSPIFDAINANPHIKYIFFSLPLVSLSAIFESLFPDISPRHSAHDRLYTDSAIDDLCELYKWERVANWFFGLDAYDLYRTMLLKLKSQPRDFRTDLLEKYFFPLIDEFQAVLDRAKFCSEAHVIAQKDGIGLKGD